MSVSLEKKLRWFAKGARAFEQTFPGLLASHLGAQFGPAYVCPLCDRAFPRQAVEAGMLTAEHVPPESFGGRELILTCKDCNNTSGSMLDAHALRKETVQDVLSGRPTAPLKVRAAIGGHTVNARLATSPTGWALHIDLPNNNPATLESLQNAGVPAPGSSMHVEFVGNRFSDLGAKISWFRSGFLALFAVSGYRFSCDPALAIVKRQLVAPETALIHTFTIAAPASLAPSDWRILEVPEPRCTAVLFGKYVLLYPHAGDLTFYDRLALTVKAQPSSATTVTAQSFSLIGTEPTFGLPEESTDRRVKS